jgi:hypothetical protein
MLAYVFWHEPDSETDRDAYERLLRSFHRTLGDHPPEGFVASKAYRAEGPRWLHVEVGYEDWYLVESWTALGTLNDAALAGPRREPHDAVARRAAGGTAGVYRLVRGEPPAGEKRFAVWMAKPRGVGYEEFLDRIETVGGETLWQRQLVLGPGPEFCLAGLESRPAAQALPAEWRPLIVERALVWPELAF